MFGSKEVESFLDRKGSFFFPAWNYKVPQNQIVRNRRNSEIVEIMTLLQGMARSWSRGISKNFVVLFQSL